MSVAEHIDAESALFVVALEDSDPDKQSALAHAADCSSCQRLLQESRAMLQLLDGEPAQVEIDAALEERIRAAVFASPAQPVRASAKHWEYFAWLFGALLSGLLILIDGKQGQPLYAELGLRCMRYELGFALIALGTGVLWTRRAGRDLGPWRGSVVAMTGALLGQTLLRVRCEAHDAALHLLAFHLAGVVIATALGALTAKLIERSA